MAIATYVGQNIGANRMDRVQEGTRAIVRVMLLTSLGLVACLLVFGEGLLGMFTNTGEVIDLGVRMLRTLSLGYIAMGFSQVFAGIMRGAGDTMPSMWIALFTQVAIRVPLAYTLAYMTRSPVRPHGSPDAIFYSLLATWTIGAVATYLWYRKGTWKEKSLIKYPVAEVVVSE
jgi:Na+-driven multidrug efflux pump